MWVAGHADEQDVLNCEEKWNVAGLQKRRACESLEAVIK